MKCNLSGCDNPIPVGNSKYCCREHGKKYRNNNRYHGKRNYRGSEKVLCRSRKCKKMFPYNPPQRYCSPKCARKIRIFPEFSKGNVILSNINADQREMLGEFFLAAKNMVDNGLKIRLGLFQKMRM